MLANRAIHDDPTLRERLAAKVDRSAGLDACWTWTGAPSAYGYGQIRAANRVRYAHRVMYELFVGPIPDGLQLDHLCRNRACVNPTHLEPVTMAENIARGWATGEHVRWQSKKTHCPQGHLYAGDNLYVYGTNRQCRICRGERQRRRRAR